MRVVGVNSVLVSGLQPSTGYKLIVYAENGVTLLSGTITASDIDVMTDVAGTSPFHAITSSRFNAILLNVGLLLNCTLYSLPSFCLPYISLCSAVACK